MKIPFDSLVLRAVVDDLRPLVGARVQRIVQPSPFDVILVLYGAAGESAVLLSCDPVFCRAHLVTRRAATLPEPPAFLSALRSRLEGSRLIVAQQVGFDRILQLGFEGESDHLLIAELMGKHANLILCEPNGKIVQAAKSVGPSKSIRPITSGRTYAPPPFPPRKSLLEIPVGESTEDAEGLSPFLKKWLDAGGLLRDAIECKWHPVLVQGAGAYPVSVERLGLAEVPMGSISEALEKHFGLAILESRVEQRKRSLESALRRTLIARETALNDLYQARDTAGRAGQFQRQGELILAYGYGFLGRTQVEAFDYDGSAVTIKVDPELSPPENAEKLFQRAKRSRSRLGLVVDQMTKFEADRQALLGTLQRLESLERLDEIDQLASQAKEQRWVQTQSLQREAVERAYDGHRIRELQGPHGFMVLVGESATANDYLTQRVAKPEDWWLHVRGQPSAHVLVPTARKPARVPFEVLLFAAKLAVQHSNQKHSRHVDVDYTLKKYVRKPRGSAPGQAFYTHEKTITVDGD